MSFYENVAPNSRYMTKTAQSQKLTLSTGTSCSSELKQVKNIFVKNPKCYLNYMFIT